MTGLLLPSAGQMGGSGVAAQAPCGWQACPTGFQVLVPQRPGAHCVPGIVSCKAQAVYAVSRSSSCTWRAAAATRRGPERGVSGNGLGALGEVLGDPP